jgi:hypothetical protein
MEKQLTEAGLVRAFADEYRHILSWRKRHHHPGQPCSWYYEGRLDEYAIWASKLARDWLAIITRQTPEHVGTDASNERAFRLVELAKEKLRVG